jgi:hypothetical protein
MAPVFTNLQKLKRFSRLPAIVTLVTLSLAPAQVNASSRSETLEAIHRIENPRDLSRPGKYGELGAYQFRQGTWHMHTTLPFEKALDRTESEQIAVKHYEWLRRGLARNGVAQTPYNIALAWNAGLSSVVRGRTSRASHDYAQRVSNLATDLRVNQLAVAP